MGDNSYLIFQLNEIKVSNPLHVMQISRFYTLKSLLININLFFLFAYDSKLQTNKQTNNSTSGYSQVRALEHAIPSVNWDIMYIT